MFKKLLFSALVLMIFSSLLFSQNKVEDFRIYYYENYDMAKNSFTQQLSEDEIKSSPKYYKVFISIKGRRVKAEKYENNVMSLYYLYNEKSELEVYFTYLYNDKNQVSKVERMNKESKLILYQIFHYDKKGLLYKIVEHLPKGTIIGERRYKYEGSNKPSKVEVYVAGKKVYTKDFKYNAYGDIEYGFRVLDPSKVDINNPDHLLWIYSEIVSNPKDANDILKKYGITGEEDIEFFYKRIAELSEEENFNEKIAAMIELREENSKVSANFLASLDMEPKIEGFTSFKRILAFDYNNFIDSLNDLSYNIEELVVEYNKLQVNKTDRYFEVMAEFVKKMRLFHKYFNVTRFEGSSRIVFEYYARNYPKSLRTFLTVTQNAGELYKRTGQLDPEFAPLLRAFNSKINQYVKIHNKLVDVVRASQPR